jgi:hypothetical protein
MIHNVSPTQQVQCQRGITQDGICFFFSEGIESLHHVVTCKTRDLDGKILFLQEIRGALRLKRETHIELLSNIYEMIFLIQRIPDAEWPIQAEIGWHRCLRGFLSPEWLEYVSPIRVSKKDKQQILSGIIVSAWKIWNMSWRRRNEDIDNNSRYSMQLQDHTNATNINILYESYTFMGRRLDVRLMKDAQTNLKEERLNITNWLIIHHKAMKAETDNFNPNLWDQIETRIRSQSFHM